MTQTQSPEAIVSVAELARRTSLSVATIYRLMPEQLERPRRITSNRVGWPASYIDRWIAERMQPQQSAA